MKLKVNREFLFKYLFAFVVFLVLGGLFAYDGLVRYPATPAPALYASIEGSEAPEGSAAMLEGFKAQKVRTQRIFALLGLLAAAGVGVHLLLACRLDLSFDDDGFVCNGVRRAYADIERVDTSAWEKKSILVLVGKEWKITLDAWHFSGVKDFFEKVKNRG